LGGGSSAAADAEAEATEEEERRRPLTPAFDRDDTVVIGVGAANDDNDAGF
jgi:hypothetical protein